MTKTLISEKVTATRHFMGDNGFMWNHMTRTETPLVYKINQVFKRARVVWPSRT